MKKYIGLYILLLTILSSCGGKQVVQTLFQKRTPYETYSQNLQAAKLHQAALGKSWLEAGEKALQDSNYIKLPYQETGYFKAEKPRAFGYIFLVKQGELINIKVSTKSKQDLKVFLDLFEVGITKPREVTHLAAADTNSLELSYKVTGNAPYLFRLQPELLVSGNYSITIVAKPSLSFPVVGKDSRAVQSFWGADRDNGIRKHEGVDIFAPKGTPAIASTAGIVTRVAETPIGGKVIWLTDPVSRQNLYYAHLDKQLVQPGQHVKIGDTLGLIGNTGNAISTPPHLHFGIYNFGYGAVDPFPFIYDPKQKPAPIKINATHLGTWGRVLKNEVAVRRSPDPYAVAITKIPKNSAFQVIAGTENWYKIQLPNGVTGFLHKDHFESAEKPIQSRNLKTDTDLTELPSENILVIASLKKDTSVSVLGFYQAYQLVRLGNGTLGWILTKRV